MLIRPASIAVAENSPPPFKKAIEIGIRIPINYRAKGQSKRQKCATTR